jgi:hypothetical protein
MKKNEPSIDPAHKGRLHSALGIKGPLSLGALMRAKDSSNPHIREMATYAVNARGWKHGR